MKSLFIKMAVVFTGAYTLASWALSLSVERNTTGPSGQTYYMRTTTDPNGNKTTMTQGPCGEETQTSSGDTCGCEGCDSAYDYYMGIPAADPEGGCGTDPGYTDH